MNDGKPHKATGTEKTIMAGLNCAEPCEIVWPILRDQADFYFACPDSITEKGMRLLANPIGDDEAIVSGESGAVTSGLVSILIRVKELENMKSQLNLNRDSVILLFSSEGDTDPEGYRKTIENKQVISI